MLEWCPILNYVNSIQQVSYTVFILLALILFLLFENRYHHWDLQLKQFKHRRDFHTYIVILILNIFFFFKFNTSTMVAGVGETYSTHSFPFSVNSFGGKIELR